ncbi:MAG: hotdog domain-containing protein [Polyangiales bacterium]
MTGSHDRRGPRTLESPTLGTAPASAAIVSLSELVPVAVPAMSSSTLPSVKPPSAAPPREHRERPSSPPVASRSAPRLPPPAMLTLHAEVMETSSPRTVRVRYPIAEAFTNPYGALQGGFLAAMFDNVIGMCAYAVDPNRPSATIELSLRYFRSLTAGYVTIDGSVLRVGRSTMTIECIARDDAGELCAKATGTNLFVE